jgi:cobalt-zinc-cadmium efflux system membrane fusion protein
LLSTAGILKTSNETLKRARELYESKSISLREFEQNMADQQTAEANFIAAKKSMLLLGFGESEIDDIIKGRKVDNELNIRSPMNGRVITKFGTWATRSTRGCTCTYRHIRYQFSLDGC